MIQIDDHRYWLYTAVDPETNEIPHIRLLSTTTTALTERFLQELTEKHDVEDAVFLVDGAQHLQTALRRHGLRFRYEKHGNRNASRRWRTASPDSTPSTRTPISIRKTRKSECCRTYL
ncbi:transposase [Natrinema pallidum DSM 3751]|uniref:Transposase n=1 Tax=Natrinema pallidum DSM 3751 TaxID=1227495 RepID=L9YSX3_9EURY|nr:transposase [Natrinema pallidum DSM 3751]